MIYGYLIGTDTGLLIKYRFFLKNKNIDENSVELLASSLIAVFSFFKSIYNVDPERIIGGNYKISVAKKSNIFIAIFSDKTDAMGEAIANKYLDIITKELKNKNIDLSVIIDEEIEEAIGNSIEELNNEIEDLIKNQQQIKYIA